jgi:hypothetical protein
VPALTSLEPTRNSAFAPIPLGRGYLAFPKAGQQKHYSLCAEVGEPCQKRLRKSVAIVAPTYRFTRQWFYRRKNPSWEIITT